MLPSARSILLRVAYRGTRYHGFQTQLNSTTVAAVLEAAVASVLNQPVKLRASSRTDAGVHALDLPVSLTTDKHIPLKGLVLGANTRLPPDIRVLQAAHFAETVDPRACSRGKIYRYLVWNGAVASPLLNGQAWHFPRPLNLTRLPPALNALIGDHDFSAFRARGCPSPHARRTITRADVQRLGPELVCFEIAGNAFVRKQVRIIIGTLMEMASGTREPENMAELLTATQRKVAGRTAPPDGLYLARVDLNLPEPLDRWPPTPTAPEALFPIFAPLLGQER